MEFSEGEGFNDREFFGFDGYLPLILGSSFLGANRAGDVFTGRFGVWELDFQVVGILAAGQSLTGYSHGHPLDHYILMPFPSFGEGLFDGDEEFWDWIYDRMTRPSSLIIEDSPEMIRQAINLVHEAAGALGVNYTFAGAAGTLRNEIELRNLVRGHQEAVFGLLAAVSAIMFTVLVILKSIAYKLRERDYFILMTTGFSKAKLAVIVWLESLLVFLPAFIVFQELLFFQSGLYWSYSILRSLTQTHGLGRRWIYRMMWQGIEGLAHAQTAPALWAAAGFTLVLFFVSGIYPIYKLRKLYRQGR